MVFLRHPSETLIRDLLVSIHFGTLCFWDSHLRPSWTICWLVLILGHGVFETPFWGPHQGSVGWYLFLDIVFFETPFWGPHQGSVGWYSFWDMAFLRYPTEALIRDLLVNTLLLILGHCVFETSVWGHQEGSVGWWFWNTPLRLSSGICWLVLILRHCFSETPVWSPPQGSVGQCSFWDIVFLRHLSEAVIRDLLVSAHFGTLFFWDTCLKPSSGICWLMLILGHFVLEYLFWDIVFLRHPSAAVKRDLSVGLFETPVWSGHQGSVGQCSFGTLCFWDTYMKPSTGICWLVLILGIVVLRYLTDL